jgi:hypothetical protein
VLRLIQIGAPVAAAATGTAAAGIAAAVPAVAGAACNGMRMRFFDLRLVGGKSRTASEITLRTRTCVAPHVRAIETGSRS